MAQHDSVFFLKLGAAYRSFNLPLKAIETLAHGVSTFPKTRPLIQCTRSRSRPRRTPSFLAGSRSFRERNCSHSARRSFARAGRCRSRSTRPDGGRARLDDEQGQLMVAQLEIELGRRLRVGRAAPGACRGRGHGARRTVCVGQGKHAISRRQRDKDVGGLWTCPARTRLRRFGALVTAIPLPRRRVGTRRGAGARDGCVKDEGQGRGCRLDANWRRSDPSGSVGNRRRRRDVCRGGQAGAGFPTSSILMRNSS